MVKYMTQVKIIDTQRRRAPSKHYVYVIEVTWSDGSVIPIYRRYSQFFEFHTTLLDLFTSDSGSDGSPRIIPYLPGKKLFGRSHIQKVAQSRLAALEEYVKVLIGLPTRISQSQHVLDFFEAAALDIKPPTAEQREKKPDSVVKRIIGADKTQSPPKEINIGEVMVLDQYRAVADYTKQDRKELTFKEGDIFEVIEKNDNGWWFVSSDKEMQGWIPATFVEPVDDPSLEEKHSQAIPGRDEKYITTQAFEAVNADEIGFDKGVIVHVIEKKLDGWWRVRYQDKEGWTPGAYLQRLEEYSSDQAQAPVSSPNNNKAHPPRRESIKRVNSIHGDKGKFALPLAGLKPKNKDAAKPTRPSKPEAAKSQPVSSPVKPAKPVIPVLPTKPSQISKVQKQDKPQTGPAKPAKPARPAQKPAQQPVRPAKLSQPTRPEQPAKPVKPPRASVGSKPSVQPVKPTKPSVQPAKPAKPAKPAQPSKPSIPAKPQDASNTVTVLGTFTATDEGTVSVREGELVTVEEDAGTGWTFVTKKDGTSGWAPSELLQPPTAAAAAAADGTATAIMDYTAGSSSELSLRKNEKVVCLETQDSWCFCRNTSGSEGWAPVDALKF